MYRATTPTHTFTLPVVASSCKVIKAIFTQGEGEDEVKKVWKYENNTLPDGMTLDGKKVIIEMTQQQTLDFKEDEQVEAQLRALTTEDKSVASGIFKVYVNKVLDEEILE